MKIELDSSNTTITVSDAAIGYYGYTGSNKNLLDIGHAVYTRQEEYCAECPLSSNFEIRTTIFDIALSDRDIIEPRLIITSDVIYELSYFYCITRSQVTL